MLEAKTLHLQVSRSPYDVPLMDGADVSPTMDGDCQPCSLGRDVTRARKIWLRAKIIFTDAGALIGQKVQISEIPVCDWPNATLRARAHARRAHEPAGASSLIWRLAARSE